MRCDERLTMDRTDKRAEDAEEEEQRHLLKMGREKCDQAIGVACSWAAALGTPRHLSRVVGGELHKRLCDAKRADRLDWKMTLSSRPDAAR